MEPPSLLFLLFLLLGFSFSAHFTCQAQLLPEDEVQTLETIATRLNNRYWNISQTSCAGGFNVNFTSNYFSNVTCDCTFENSTVCHVTNIQLKGLNLTGIMPDEFGNLTYLQEMSALGNRLSGSIPKEIGDIATLEELVLEDNQLEGSLPENLGNLSSLSRLLLTANNFTGTIPETFGNLKNLTDVRLDGNAFSGKIPDFIGNWTQLDRLRIADLNGSSMAFPNLQNLTKMEELVLRNCSITDSIPDYIGKMASLKTLDLSFNRLSGKVSDTWSLSQLEYLFLTNNSLSGTLPSWISDSNQKLLVFLKFLLILMSNSTILHFQLRKLSSNAVTISVAVMYLTTTLQGRRLSQFASKGPYYSLFINCGGSEINYEGNDYERDLDGSGASHFSDYSEKWGYSSTGVFTNNDDAAYVATNTFSLNITGPEYLQTARTSPISLKYYGLCMRKGSYRVQLHFAEIMFSDDETFSSLGKRIFDVSIQGVTVLKDFNIVEEAKGVGKAITKDFETSVNGSTLEIHLYWAGKGTNAIPSRGVYGPLISAITVTPNFDVSTGLSAGAIAGIVIASIAAVVLILIVLRLTGYLGGKDQEDKELQALKLQTGYFSLRQIKAATNNFDPANKIGEGGFGPVYKGVLPDGSVIAVKQLSSKSKQGNREFVNEIGMISALQHPNLVKLYGWCIEGNQLLLIYEYLENNCLARALFGRIEQRLNLDWPTRNKICLGIARGLAYLHEESRLKIVHRDIKATNVLLDKDLNAKISDFGLAKLDEEENTHISTRIAGTIGYMAPEYAMRGYLTDKADVYSFGIVALEIVSGKSNTNYRPKEEFVYLLDWAYVLQEQENLLELVDPSLGSKYSKEEAQRMLNLALLCANPSPTLRPSMSSVVSMLEGKTAVQVPLIKRSSMNSMNLDMRFKAFEKLSQDSQTYVSERSQGSQMQRSMSMDGPWFGSSVSFPDKDKTREHSSSSKQKLLHD
uniref:non-specific serine/threonine protein kinase n=1 Tax=Vitis vinifera TaxID=29760 RepID=A5C3D9_VITVI|nr:hypothetical protein VITISV_034284 [Vitis vinifera]